MVSTSQVNWAMAFAARIAGLLLETSPDSYNLFRDCLDLWLKKDEPLPFPLTNLIDGDIADESIGLHKGLVILALVYEKHKPRSISVLPFTEDSVLGEFGLLAKDYKDKIKYCALLESVPEDFPQEESLILEHLLKDLKTRLTHSTPEQIFHQLSGHIEDQHDPFAKQYPIHLGHPFRIENGVAYYEGSKLDLKSGNIILILRILVSREGRVVTLRRLEDEITLIEYVRIYIYDLRRAFKKHGIPYLIRTVKGEGYMLEKKASLSEGTRTDIDTINTL